jgi:hypothetical protein
MREYSKVTVRNLSVTLWNIAAMAAEPRSKGACSQ